MAEVTAVMIVGFCGGSSGIAGILQRTVMQARVNAALRLRRGDKGRTLPNVSVRQCIGWVDLRIT
jgi:hypothetical protein